MCSKQQHKRSVKQVAAQAFNQASSRAQDGHSCFRFNKKSYTLEVPHCHLVLQSPRIGGPHKIELVYICSGYDLTKLITKHCTTGGETELWSKGVPTFWLAWGNATCRIIKLFLQKQTKWGTSSYFYNEVSSTDTCHQLIFSHMHIII